MTALSFINKACLTPRNERSHLQNFLVELTNKWITVRYWWPRHAKKYDVTTIDGVRYYESLCDMRTWVLYDKKGYLHGWHGQDMYGDGDWYFKPASAVHGNKKIRMHWLSRLRSPKIG